MSACETLLVFATLKTRLERTHNENGHSKFVLHCRNTYIFTFFVRVTLTLTWLP